MPRIFGGNDIDLGQYRYGTLCNIRQIAYWSGNEIQCMR